MPITMKINGVYEDVVAIYEKVSGSYVLVSGGGLNFQLLGSLEPWHRQHQPATGIAGINGEVWVVDTVTAPTGYSGTTTAGTLLGSLNLGTGTYQPR